MEISALFCYSGGPLSKGSPEIKLLALLTLSGFGMSASLTHMSFIAPLLIFVYATMSITMCEVRRDFFIVATICALTTFFCGLDLRSSFFLNTEGIMSGFEVSARFTFIFYCGKIFYGTTRLSDLRDAMIRIGTLLCKEIAFGFYISLVLVSIPMVFEQWERVMAASKARAFGQRLFSILQLFALIPLLRRCLLRSAQLSDALVARAFGSSFSLPPFKVKTVDIAVSITCFFAVALLLLRSPE